ncbi:lipopolysaccharide biosynthesis protein [Caulobacter segnis]
MNRLIQRLRQADLMKVRAFGISLAVMLALPIIQFVLFAFYARVLGPAKYGVYIALMAWAPICLEVVSMGAGELMIKRAARTPEVFPRALGHFFSATVATFPIAFIIYVAITFQVVKNDLSFWTVAAVGACELMGYRLLVGAENAAIALRNLGAANQFRFLQAFPRGLGVLICYAVFGMRSLSALALAGSLGILLGGLLAAAIARWVFPKAEWNLDRPALREGFWFAGNQLARASQQNIDRVVLSLLVDPATLAVYGAAQRFVQVGILPIQAILRMTYPGFFAEGRKGIAAARRYGQKVLWMVLGAATASCIGLWVFSQAIPFVIGHGFGQSTTYLIWLAPTLLLYACNYVAADTLSGADHQRLRTTLMLSAIAVQSLCFVVLKQGAGLIAAVYAGVGLAAISNWIAVYLLTRRAEKAGALPA